MTIRIAIRGASGSGKSTLARQLAQDLGVAYVELDAMHHGPNWRAASASELQARVNAALDDRAGWVVDGNYDGKLHHLVLDRAELIVWLDLPLWTKLLRLVVRTSRRWLANEELWNGNRENWRSALWGGDALFPWAVRSHFRYRRDWPEVFAGRTVVRLRSASEVRRWRAQFLERRGKGAPDGVDGVTPARASTWPRSLRGRASRLATRRRQ
jgi:adenylate kinase family enzyme